MKIETSDASSTRKQHFDVVISGGGLSGSLMALSLLSLKNQNNKTLSIAIIEAVDVSNSSKASKTQSVFDDRVLALSHASAQYLKTLDVWPYIQEHAQPITDIHISDRGYYGKARIKAIEHVMANKGKVEAVGYVIEMSKLGLALQQAIENHVKHEKASNKNGEESGLTWFTPDTIENIEWQAASVNLTLASQTQLSASLLIGCDGVNSICRQSANIACDRSEYGQSALITNVSTTLPHHGVAFERFTENGPIAMLPMVKVVNEGSRSSLVWTLTPEQAEAFSSLTDDEFKIKLEASFGSWLGAIEKIGKRHIYPLSLVQAQEQVYHRMVLIGNASHTIHPIAGQGFNLGLRDVQTLAHTLKQTLAEQGDIGAFNRLTEYAASRKTDHQHIITLTDSLVTLFSNELLPLVVGRNIGLKVLNYIPVIKNTFVNKAMGY
jgi:2-octaprenyl-6-methoxyphenol hydroxylase